MPYPLGNRALKRIFGKRIMCGRTGVGGIWGGEQMEPKLLAPRPERASSGKDSFLLLVNFLFVTIICCVRNQQIEEESVIMMDAFLSLVDVTC